MITKGVEKFVPVVQDEPTRAARRRGLREAASAQQQDVTFFVLGAAMERTCTVLMEQRVMLLTAREAGQVEEALDHEARVISDLATLIREVKHQRIDAQNPATGA